MNIQISKVISNECLADGIFSLWLSVSGFDDARPGQFVNLYSKDSAHILPRPISICDVSEEKDKLRLVFREIGYGTHEFSELKAGDEVRLLGPLGNGYPSEFPSKKALLLGGGLGVPPMLYLLKSMNIAASAVIGYRDKHNTFLMNEFESTGKKIYFASDDGSIGTHGNVIDAIRENSISCDIIFACGPRPMLAAVKKYASENGIELYVSMEEHMACGVGACLGCVVESTEKDAHSNVKNKRVCKDGPVFNASDIVI